jgi:hypothetical protein
MTKPHKSQSPAQYRIKLKGRLDNSWSESFEGMAFSWECGETILTGQVADQAALHGLLNRIRDMNLVLLSVEQTNHDDKEKK